MHEAAPGKDQLVEDAVGRFGLSSRGAYNYIHNDHWGAIERALSNPWAPENPEGLWVSATQDEDENTDRLEESFSA